VLELLDSTNRARGGESEFRFDLLTREWVAITGDRQRRPNLPTSDCPFCIGGIEAPEPYVVKAFPNRWPALTPGDGVEFAGLERELTKRAPARGASEVVLYSPDHNTTFASLGSEQIRRVIDVWAARTDALLSRREIRYVLVFENRGPEVGATISHPHSQIYAFPFVPPVAALEAAVATQFGCQICVELATLEEDRARLVVANDSFVAFARFAAGWPYELILAPREHLPDLSSLDRRLRSNLAALLADVLGRYDRLFDQQLPYMLWLHPGVHLHFHAVTSRRRANTTRFVAAGELGSGVMFNPVAPEEAAAQLRSAVPLPDVESQPHRTD
jgi:UDPglucose--hexose-1-phosphate uridylyltransferase